MTFTTIIIENNEEEDDNSDNNNAGNNDGVIVITQIFILVFCFCVAVCFIYYWIIYRRNGGSFNSKQKRYSVKNNTVTVVINSKDSKDLKDLKGSNNGRRLSQSQHSTYSISNNQSQNIQSSINASTTVRISQIQHSDAQQLAYAGQSTRMQRLYTISATSDGATDHDDDEHDDEDQNTIVLSGHDQQRQLRDANVSIGEEKGENNNAYGINDISGINGININSNGMVKNGEDDLTTIVEVTEGPDWSSSSSSESNTVHEMTQGIFNTRASTFGSSRTSASIKVQVIDGGAQLVQAQNMPNINNNNNNHDNNNNYCYSNTQKYNENNKHQMEQVQPNHDEGNKKHRETVG